jgi:VanZ family protein
MQSATRRQMAFRLTVLAVVGFIGASLLFLVPGPNLSSSRLTHRIWNLGHPGLFGILSGLTFWVFKERLEAWNTWTLHACTVGLVFIVGGSTELIQTAFGREASWDDVGRNLVGAFLVSAFFSPTKPLDRPIRIGLRVIAVAFLCVVFIPVSRTAIDLYYRNQQHPILADFSTRFELDRWLPTFDSSARMSDRFGEETGRNCLEVNLGSELYAGVALTSPFGDFNGHENLRLRIYNSDELPLALVCRLNDLAHDNAWYDRFTKEFHLQPGWNTVRFSLDEIKNAPRDRQMNLSEIRVLLLFRSEPSLRKTVYIDRLWLD